MTRDTSSQHRTDKRLTRRALCDNDNGGVVRAPHDSRLISSSESHNTPQPSPQELQSTLVKRTPGPDSSTRAEVVHPTCG